MTAEVYSFRGRQYVAQDLLELLIAEGLASPAARDMKVTELIDALVDQQFLDRQDAPKKVSRAS